MGKDERDEIPAERQWATLEVMGLTNKDPTKEVGDGVIAMTVTASPNPPPPKAPTYVRDPISSSHNRLGAKSAKGSSKRKDSKGGPKARIPKGEQRKRPPREIAKGIFQRKRER